MINYNESNKTFTIETKNSVYIIAVMNGLLGHVYYGDKINIENDISYLLRSKEYPFAGTYPEREVLSFHDMFPFELPFDGMGDFRNSALAVRSSKGNNGIVPKYKSFKIYKNYSKLDDFPHVFGSNAETLEITTFDEFLNCEVILSYTIFDDTDAIIRSTKIVNKSNEPLFLTKAFSASFDMDNDNYDLITLHGSWARERHIDRRPIHGGIQSVVSVRGSTSHQEHPFLAVLESNTDYNNGKVYGVNFIYSGNFAGIVQKNQFDSIRIQMGINPDNFEWKLQPEASFQTPQAVLVYSNHGLNGMSQSFHKLYKKHLIRSPYNDKMRPILINNWEATYFDFNTEKLLDIAREAAKDGIEMLVMDDGWFGKRNFDNCSLGDWIVNEEKIQGGLNYLVTEVNKLGLKFGIWFEPEMISPDSDLFRAHPDWAIQIQGRTPYMSREQYVLDITRDEVRDHVYNSVKTILKSANIEYVKWDMNRQLCDIGSACLPSDQMGEFFHKYVLAVYKMQDQLVTDFPNLLLENCSGGGARFDPGMLFYSPQIWTSDDTDAIERLSIQEGTAICYPLSSMGAHVSVCPNHAVGRNTPFKTRGYVALSGTFGYELDITKIPEEDRKMIPSQIALYKKFNDLIRTGDYYRISSYQENHSIDCWASIAEDKTCALITCIQVFNQPNCKSRILKIPGLNPDFNYNVSYPDENEENFKSFVLSGATLMNAGILLQREWGDFQGKLIYLKKI